MPEFEYTARIIDEFPSVIGGVLIGTVVNTPTTQALETLYAAEQKAVKERIGDKPLSSLPSLSAWRSAFKQFGVDPTRYRSAAEALLRRLTKKGDIPSINALVDTGNLVSIRYGLPVAIVDIRDLVGDTLSVRFAAGDESFLSLGAEAPEQPEAGEVIFTDASDTVYARRWCWRQSQGSAAREDTTSVIVTVEAHHADGRATIDKAVADLEQLLKAYAAFSGSIGVVSADSPAFSA